MLNVFAEPSGRGLLAGVRQRQEARANASAYDQTQMRVNGGRGRAAYRTDTRRQNLGPTMGVTRVAGGRGRNQVRVGTVRGGRGRNAGLVTI